MTDTDTPVLHSSYALEQLRRVALASSDLSFAQAMLPVFEGNLPVLLFKALHTALVNGEVANPTLRVADLETGVAHYNYATRTLTVSQASLDEAVTESEKTPGVLMALIEAFGQHLDNILRHDFAQALPEGGMVFTEAPAELSDNYAASVTFMDEIPRNGVSFGHYTSVNFDGPLVLTLPALLPVDKAESTERTSRTKRFAEGHGNPLIGEFGHASVERGPLLAAGFTEEQCERIYFGNWLRDHSQIVDPKLVRAPEAPPAFPALFSRRALTQIVDVMAVRVFHGLEADEAGRADYTVTPEKLLVYRPREHIDNPVNFDENAVDPQTIDPDFDPIIRPGDPLDGIHAKYSLPLHFKFAVRYMRDKLKAARAEGMTPAGFRYFGEALHVLEDLFAHSNYAELCLRKLGYDEIAVWTVPKEDTALRLPLITGVFGSVDVIASVAEPLAKALFPLESLDYKGIEPGHRSDTEKMLLIMLKDMGDHKAHDALQQVLRQRDKAASNPFFQTASKAAWVAGLPLNALSYAKNLVMQPLIRWAGDNVGHWTMGDDPNLVPGVHATHSQLAKDHGTHPLHGLAVALAQSAVERVARAMFEAWHGTSDRRPEHLASSYFVHPHTPSIGWYIPIVQAWVDANPGNVSQASHYLQELQHRIEELNETMARLRDLGKDDTYKIREYSEALTQLNF
jgi:hypothetical protein